MLKKTLLILGVFSVALIILLISIFDSSAITYPISHTLPQTNSEAREIIINYSLPYAGEVLPDSPLWKLKALRDKVWFTITTSHIRKAQLALLFADKRLVMSKILFEKGKSEVAVATFTKGEKYLPIAVEEEKIARKQGVNTNDFLQQLAIAALKHKEVAEGLIELAPDDARPLIISAEVYAEDTYKAARDALYSKDLPVPKNPFDRD